MQRGFLDLENRNHQLETLGISPVTSFWYSSYCFLAKDKEFNDTFQSIS